MDIILGYKDLFDDEPELIDSYLNGIDKNSLIDYALYYCSLSTTIGSDVNKIFDICGGSTRLNGKFHIFP